MFYILLFLWSLTTHLKYRCHVCHYIQQLLKLSHVNEKLILVSKRNDIVCNRNAIVFVSIVYHAIAK